MVIHVEYLISNPVIKGSIFWFAFFLCFSTSATPRTCWVDAAVNCVKKACFFAESPKTKKTFSNVTIAMGRPIRGGCTSEKKDSFQQPAISTESFTLGVGMFHYESPIIDLGGLTGQVKTYSYKIRRYFKQLNLNKWMGYERILISLFLFDLLAKKNPAPQKNLWSQNSHRFTVLKTYLPMNQSHESYLGALREGSCLFFFRCIIVCSC